MLNKKETILLVIIVCVLLALGLGLGIGLGMKKHHHTGGSPTPGGGDGPCAKSCKTSVKAQVATGLAKCIKLASGKPAATAVCKTTWNTALAEAMKACECSSACLDNNNCNCNHPLKPTCSTPAMLKKCQAAAAKC